MALAKDIYEIDCLARDAKEAFLQIKSSVFFTQEGMRDTGKSTRIENYMYGIVQKCTCLGSSFNIMDEMHATELILA